MAPHGRGPPGAGPGRPLCPTGATGGSGRPAPEFGGGVHWNPPPTFRVVGRSCEDGGGRVIGPGAGRRSARGRFPRAVPRRRERSGSGKEAARAAVLSRPKFQSKIKISAFIFASCRLPTSEGRWQQGAKTRWLLSPARGGRAARAARSCRGSAILFTLFPSLTPPAAAAGRVDPGPCCKQQMSPGSSCR